MKKSLKWILLGVLIGVVAVYGYLYAFGYVGLPFQDNSPQPAPTTEPLPVMTDEDYVLQYAQSCFESHCKGMTIDSYSITAHNGNSWTVSGNLDSGEAVEIIGDFYNHGPAYGCNYNLIDITINGESVLR